VAESQESLGGAPTAADWEKILLDALQQGDDWASAFNSKRLMPGEERIHEANSGDE
jgi:hypothetical protein